MSAWVDHLVVAASTLAEGVLWCEQTLGVTPGPGGKHALMGTHNRLLKIATPRYPLAYLEIIAIDPEAPPPPRKRWFGLDERAGGDAPQLVHFVARAAPLTPLHDALCRLGLDPGVPTVASRESAHGRLQWLITLRDDGRPQCGGALPTLIEWQGPHPALSMPDSGVTLQGLTLAGLPSDAAAALALHGVELAHDAASALRATLDTPRGRVVLDSGPRGHDA